MADDARTWRVLVADDHLDHLEMICRAIERSPSGHRIKVVRATDGNAAYAALKEGVDMAFLDIKMPGQSGLSILRASRAEPSLAEVPIVIVSSSSDPWDIEASTNYGAKAYIEKGRYDRFRDRIVSVLEETLAMLA
ncbi:MAG: response regulator [Euryarchaeota archaeon]|nr:response regulator [Euryarchaeota archaeon]